MRRRFETKKKQQLITTTESRICNTTHLAAGETPDRDYHDDDNKGASFAKSSTSSNVFYSNEEEWVFGNKIPFTFLNPLFV